MAGAGDVNGDGYDDVIIGAYLFDNGETDEGAAFLYLGSPAGLGASPAWVADGAQTGAHFGDAVASAGDVDNDGFADVVVGAPTHDVTVSNEGRVYLFLGGSGGLTTSAAKVISGGQSDADFGATVAGAGDIDNDGPGELVVGAPRYDNGQADEGAAFAYKGVSSLLPPPGGIYYYLIRPRNGCGSGPLGDESSGTPRSAGVCP